MPEARARVELRAVSYRPEQQDQGHWANSVPLLTAATFEQRMDQFERLLIEGQFGGDLVVYLCQAVRDEPGSDQFLTRPIGTDNQAHGAATPTAGLRTLKDEQANLSWRQWYWYLPWHEQVYLPWVQMQS